MTRTLHSLTSVLLILLTASPLAAQNDVQPEDGTPRFDHFTYEGRDPVYDSVAAGPDEYLNPIIAGFYPDPSIVAVGEDFYLVNSSFSYYPGVPIFHSTDLVNWTQIGHVLDRPSQLNLDSLGISRGVFAPSIHYHDGTFYMISTLVDAGGNFYVTADDPAGPWSDPVWLPFYGIDPSIFFDDAGKAYLVNNDAPAYEPLYDGHRAIWMREFDPTSGTVGDPWVIVDGGVDLSSEPIWIEAPHIYKVDGKYYLICAEGGTADWHSEVVFRADKVEGPYVPFEGNPILTQRHLDNAAPFHISTTGHADFVETVNGEWWAVFLGTRPYEDEHYNIGRETFLLPVSWEDGWPVILKGDARVPYSLKRPNLPQQPRAGIPHNGNFTLREEFDRTTLDPYWNFIRTPHEPVYDLTSHPGWLTLSPRRVRLQDPAQPAFVGRRQQHAWASASTAMEYRPADEGDAAGLVAFHDEDNFYAMLVTRAGDVTMIQLTRANRGLPEIIASVPIDLPDDDTVHLKIDAAGSKYSFYFAVSPDEWVPLLEDADGRVLSTRVAGGFVGTYFGFYSFGDDK
ncbi:MAG TPA: glycoside hydrolase family 43 protein [Rhodothermales bacterium]|nr:glycoside hydrolase family 43 protein [Rhodothermales bacterium]